MSKYEMLKNKKNYCEAMARAHSDDDRLTKFYINAAAGFQLRLDSLTVQEAGEIAG